MFSHTVPAMNPYVVTTDPGSRQPRVNAARRSAVQAMIIPSAVNGTSALPNFTETASNDRTPPNPATPTAATTASPINQRRPRVDASLLGPDGSGEAGLPRR